MLFNCLLEHIFRRVKCKWSAKSYGLQIGATARNTVTNLRFADDVLIIGRTANQLSTMLADLTTEASSFGLNLHPDKTKVLTSATKATGRGNKSHISVNDMMIEILPIDGTMKYLGCKITLEGLQRVATANPR